MLHFRIAAALILALGLSACGSLGSFGGSGAASGPVVSLHPVKVTGHRVDVPRSLRVSEENTYYPMGDIVWRGDPHGDRYAQVNAIFTESLRRVGSGPAGAMAGATPVVVEIEVRRFHSLTEKTRYTVGGVHSIRFDMTLRDPRTGAVLAPARTIRADLKGYGGARALEADRQGLGQKVRVTQHLTNVIRAELVNPGSTGRGVTQLVAGLETAGDT